MRTEVVPTTLHIPDVTDFLNAYPRYRKFIADKGLELFEEMRKPSLIIRAKSAVELGYPAVLAAGDTFLAFCKKHGIDTKDKVAKQCAGAIACVLMEANGFKKVGKQRRVPHKAFGTAETYVPVVPAEDKEDAFTGGEQQPGSES